MKMKTIKELKNKFLYDKSNNSNNNNNNNNSINKSCASDSKSSYGSSRLSEYEINNIINSLNNNNNSNNNKSSSSSSSSSSSIISTTNNVYNNIINNNLIISNYYSYTSNLNNINWNTIINIETLDTGNSNIFLLVSFLDDQQNQINQILLKTSQCIFQEVYASVLENMLNYPIPEMKLIEFSSDEFTEMSNSLLNFTQHDDELNQFIKLELDKSFILALEFKQNGKRFNELNHKEYFSGSKGEKKLKQLGKVIAFEIFSNNFCRSTSTWDENTFFSNLIFYDTPNKDGWYFSMIHSNINYLSNSLFTIGYRDQINKLKLLLFSIFQNPNSESEQIKQMKDHFVYKLKVKLPSSSYVYIQKGIAAGIKKIVSTISFQILEEKKEKIKCLIKIDNSSNTWKKGFDSLYCPFLLDMLNEFVVEFTNYIEKNY